MLRAPRLAVLMTTSAGYSAISNDRTQLQALVENQSPSIRFATPKYELEFVPIQDFRLAHYGIIVLLESFQRVGYVSSIWVPEGGYFYVGYGIGDQFKGNGYASEALSAAIEWFMTWPEVKAVVAETFPESPASIRVMEKCGMAEIDANVGSGMVRRAIVKPGAEIDLVEKNIVKLKPFRYSLKYRLRQYVQAGLDYMNHVNVVQFRESGLFRADWSGNGGLTPWEKLTHYRLPRSGGFELWDGATWFSIPANAFDEGLKKEAVNFVRVRGLKSV